VRPISLRHQELAVNPLAAFLDELAALVFIDWPGNAVGEQPVADDPRGHGVANPRIPSQGRFPIRSASPFPPSPGWRRRCPWSAAPRNPQRALRSPRLGSPACVRFPVAPLERGLPADRRREGAPPRR